MHKEHRLGGVVEAAISHVLYNEEWLQAMADSPTIDQNTPHEVFLALEDYVCEELALKR